MRLFAERMELPASQRRQFVESACGADAELCDLVVELLEVEQDSAGQLEAPETGLSRRFVEELAQKPPSRQIGRYTLVREIDRKSVV